MKEKTFEEKIIEVLENGILEKIKNNMGWHIENAINTHGFYQEIAKGIVEKHRTKIETTVDKGVEKAFKSADFVSEMEKTINKKLCENILSKFDSEVQSVIDKLRAKNAVFNDEIKIAVMKVLKKYNE